MEERRHIHIVNRLHNNVQYRVQLICWQRLKQVTTSPGNTSLDRGRIRVREEHCDALDGFVDEDCTRHTEGKDDSAELSWKDG